MKVIINCDDFGVSYGVNEGIKESYLKGIATSASIRTNGPAFNEACELSFRVLKKMGLGLHLNLTDGKPHTKKLSNKKGFYKYSFPSYVLHTTFYKDIKLLKAIENELDTQFQICLYYNLPIDHVDGQDHVQMIPDIFDIVCRLCRKYGISKIRVSNEDYYLIRSLKLDLLPFFNANVLKQQILNFFSREDRRLLKKYNLKSTDSYYGVLHTNFMTTKVIESNIDNAQLNNFQSIEIALHPAHIHHKKDKVYTSPFSYDMQIFLID